MVSHRFTRAFLAATFLLLSTPCAHAQSPSSAIPPGTTSDTTTFAASSSAQFRKWRNAQPPSIELAVGDTDALQMAQALAQKEATANTEPIPKQILKTGINLNYQGLSANTLQLADTIKLSPVLENIQALKSKVEATKAPSIENLTARQDLFEARQTALLLIQKTDLEIDFTMAEIVAENEVYAEVLATFINDRDRAITRTNAAGFISNGVLWAACEALTIPSFKNAKFAIPSGILGIPAGVVPSIASMWTLKQLGGKRKKSEVEPNMLAGLFDYPINGEIEFPRSVWLFLNQVPPGDATGRTRKDQLIDRWIADDNIRDFNDRKAVKTLDVLTASVAHNKALDIGTLTARKVMLDQLAAEVMKMKRLLLELAMALEGTKQLTVYEQDPSTAKYAPKIGSVDTVH